MAQRQLAQRQLLLPHTPSKRAHAGPEGHEGRSVSTSSRCFRRRFSWAALTSSALRRRQAAARWRASLISGSGPAVVETSSAKVAGSSFARAAAASAAFLRFVAKVSSALPSQASQTRRMASFLARVHAP